MKEWQTRWFGLDGKEDVLTHSQLYFGRKTCHNCFSNVVPVLTCEKCKTNQCDACQVWDPGKRNKRFLVAVCFNCGYRMDMVT
jgi:hypothetical protein